MPPPSRRRRRGTRARRAGFQRRYHRRPEFEPAAEIGTLYEHEDRTLIEKYGKMAAPYYRIAITDKDDEVLFETDAILHDQALDMEGRVVSEIEYEEDIDGAAQLSLTINNPDINLQDSRTIAEGNNIDFWIGYDGHEAFYIGRGIIIEVKPDFGSTQIPKITIRGMDISYFMMEDSRAEIQKEGSSWWERYLTRRPPARQDRAVPGQDRPPRDTNAYQDSISDGERVRIESWNADAREFGLDQLVIPTQTGAEAAAEGVNLDRTGAPIESVTSSRRTREENERERRAEMVLAWRQQKFGNRRRRAGHVWRGYTDAEIVAAIFHSYGILPYIEATNERRRTASEFARPEVGEDRVVGTTAYPDRINARELARRRRLNALVPEGQPRLQTITGAEAASRGIVIDRTGREIVDVVIPREELGNLPLLATAYEEREVVQKAGTTDWDFIKGLARKHGFILFVFFDIESNTWVGFWGPAEHVPQDQQFEFEYKRDVDSTVENVTPTLSMRGQSTEIDLIYTDPRNRRESRLRIAVENVSDYSPEFRGPDGPMQIEDPVGNGPEVTLLIHGQRIVTHARQPFETAEEARQWLMGYWLRHANDFLLIEGKTIIGIPELRAREFHLFTGIGRLEGEYFVTTARHRLSPGQLYQTEFSGRKVLAQGWRASDNAEIDLLTVDSYELGVLPPDTEDEVHPRDPLPSPF
jgi:hypothetical protein